MKLPTRISALLGAILAAVLAVSTQLPHVSPEAHLAIVFVGALAAALGIHPSDLPIGGAREPDTMPPSDGANQKAAPATPAAP